ncbi:haloalkane dehalogenase [Paenibacillus oenotherae]|uniref:Haloalkane dehalogenase n=1 Tax=Paenibacillus oenotherae TaxID=1435645 RepID=A0ABS7D7C5_9BACL|nr:haloalkane dehalogenase [Paenibacillus oenotherae]MBW7475734.1 haloalkane dehalogenase [Paenibacillus oenotherae]
MSTLETQPIGQDYPFESQYRIVNDHRLHYMDQGTGDPVVFLHGNPTWSYTFRNIIPYVQHSNRCIAVDLIGMGRSDKPDIGYTFLEHVDYVTRFIEELGLSDIVLVGHDWGVAIGLQYAMNHRDKVKAVAMIEPQALYPNHAWSDFSPAEAQSLFQTLRDPEKGWPFMRDNSVFIEGMTTTIINRPITAEEHEQYREPFRNPEDRKPMWVFPNQIPIEGHPSEVVEAVMNRNAWFTASPIPKLLIYATPGCTVREPQINWCRTHLHNLTLCDSGKGFHYLTEENPHVIGQELQRWLHQINESCR